MSIVSEPATVTFGPPASIQPYPSVASATPLADVRPLSVEEVDEFVGLLTTGTRSIYLPEIPLPFVITKWRYWIERTNEKIKSSYGNILETAPSYVSRSEILSPTAYFLSHVNVADWQKQAMEAPTAPLGPLLPADVNTMESALERTSSANAAFYKRWLRGANEQSIVIKGTNPNKTIVPTGTIQVRGPMMLPERQLKTSEPLFGNLLEHFTGSQSRTNDLLLVFVGLFGVYLIFANSKIRRN